MTTPERNITPEMRFSETTERVLALARQEAINRYHGYIGTEHILLALLAEPFTQRVLSIFNQDVKKIYTSTNFFIGRGDTPPVEEPELTPLSKKIVEFAIEEARFAKREEVMPSDLLIGSIRESNGVAAAELSSIGIDNGSLDEIRRLHKDLGEMD